VCFAGTSLIHWEIMEACARCRECDAQWCTTPKCRGPKCWICERIFDRRQPCLLGGFSGNLAKAKEARDACMQSHPKHLDCPECGDIVCKMEHNPAAIARAKQTLFEHRQLCLGWLCPHCLEYFPASDSCKHEAEHWDNGTYRHAGMPRQVRER